MARRPKMMELRMDRFLTFANIIPGGILLVPVLRRAIAGRSADGIQVEVRRKAVSLRPLPQKRTTRIL